jgi:hypothetical protein
MTNNKLNISEMKRLNGAAGHTWFNKREMVYFGTRIECQPNAQGFFITSEDGDFQGSWRGYTLRRFDLTTHEVHTVGDFNQFETRAEAMERRKQATKHFKQDTYFE